MTLLAHSLRRIWSATNRLPHLAGWGRSGYRKTGTRETLVSTARLRFLALVEMVQRAAPTVIVFTLNVFR